MNTLSTDSRADSESTIGILLAMIDIQWGQARQSEDQRATMTNYIIAIVVTLQGFIVQRQFDTSSIMLAILLVLLGIYGVAVNAKLYERFRLHTNRAGEMIKRLDTLVDMAQIRSLQKVADEEHNTRFPRMSKTRLHYFWYTLNAGFALLGVVNIIVIVLSN